MTNFRELERRCYELTRRHTAAGMGRSARVTLFAVLRQGERGITEGRNVAEGENSDDAADECAGEILDKLAATSAVH